MARKTTAIVCLAIAIVAIARATWLVFVPDASPSFHDELAEAGFMILLAWGAAEVACQLLRRRRPPVSFAAVRVYPGDRL